MKKLVVWFMIMSLITVFGISSNSYAGRNDYYKERMKDVKKIAVLPMDYELIVPSPDDPEKQREGFSEEETKKRRGLRISQFPGPSL